MNIRTRLSLTWYVLTRFTMTSFIIFILSTAALISSIIAIFNKSGLALYIAIFFISIGILARLMNIYQICSPSAPEMELEQTSFLSGMPDSVDYPFSQLEIHEVEREQGFKMLRLCNGGIVTASDKIDSYLIMTPKISCRVKKNHEKQILKQFKMYWSDFRDFLNLKALYPGKLFNERKIAMISRLTSSSSTMDIGYTTYFSSCVTNEASSYIIRRQGVKVKDFRPLFPVEWNHSSPQLRPIETSILSNHIGVCVLARSSDGYLIPWLQNKYAQQNVGELVPTSAGSLDWTDIRKCKSLDFLTIVRYGMARELHEESELHKALHTLSMLDLAKHVLIIGYFRWLIRGGKPEFIGIGQVPFTYQDFSPQQSEVERAAPGSKIIKTWHVKSVQDVLNFCDFYLNYSNNKAGIQLCVVCERLRSILLGVHGDESKEILMKFWNLS